MILIPDLHGRMFWKEAVANADEATRIIFLGDYTDPYGFEEITPKEAFDNFVAVLEYARSHPNVELLLGNHDCGYLFGEEVCCCRSDEERYAEIRQLFLDNLGPEGRSLHFGRGPEGRSLHFGRRPEGRSLHLGRGLFKFCTEVKVGGKCYLVSHAGINRQWLEAHAGEFFPDGEIDYASLCERVNGYFLREPIDYSQVALLSEAGHHRGGVDACGSIVWADINEFDDEGAHIPVDQIVGHTLQVSEVFDDGDYVIYYGGACIKRGPRSAVYCIDTAEAYYLDAEGLLQYMRCDGV